MLQLSSLPNTLFPQTYSQDSAYVSSVKHNHMRNRFNVGHSLNVLRRYPMKAITAVIPSLLDTLPSLITVNDRQTRLTPSVISPNRNSYHVAVLAHAIFEPHSSQSHAVHGLTLQVRDVNLNELVAGDEEQVLRTGHYERTGSGGGWEGLGSAHEGGKASRRGD